MPKEFYVGQSEDFAKAGWNDWPGQVKGRPGTISHFQRWTNELVFEDGRRHPLEDWQLDFVRDLFALTKREYGMGPLFEELWLVVPEGNSKSTFIAEIVLYHLETVSEPWVPVGASSRDQAEILFGQAQGFVDRTPGLKYHKDMNEHGPFQGAGTRQLRHRFSGGKGMKVYAADHETADGVIPTLPIIDEGHRLRNLSLYRLWKGKLEKRHGRIVMISTAGEPGKDFEKTRKALRTAATDVQRRGRCFGRYESPGAVLHEYALPNTALVEDMFAVKEANPLAKITVGSLTRKRASPTLDYGEGWLRLTCNIASRSSKAAVNDAEWDDAILKPGEWEDAPDGVIPWGVPVAVGLDVAWTLDTTALTPLWIPEYTRRLLGPATILEPPGSGAMLDPQAVHDAFHKINDRNPIYMVVMDMTKAQETAKWLAGGGDQHEYDEDDDREIGELDDEGRPRHRRLEVEMIVDRTQSNKHATEDYEAFMEALRGGAKGDEMVRQRWLRHTGDTGLREHVMNAIARTLPGDRYRFDRPTPTRTEAEQDHRVVDALSAASMVNRSAAAALGAAPLTPMVAVRGR